MANAQKIILDLCGGSGAWSMPYKIAGYDVRLVTLPEKDVFTYKPPANVYGILAAPPCTEFSKAKGSHPRDFENAMRIVKACLNIVWLCRLRNPLAFWCLENPVGFLRQFLGKPPLTIEHWWYGADIKKPTDLWGYYNFPKQQYFEPPELFRNLSLTYNWDNKASERNAVTPSDFANAFFKANP